MIPDADSLCFDKESIYSDLGFDKESVYSERLPITCMLTWSRKCLLSKGFKLLYSNFVNLKFNTTFQTR